MYSTLLCMIRPQVGAMYPGGTLYPRGTLPASADTWGHASDTKGAEKETSETAKACTSLSCPVQ